MNHFAGLVKRVCVDENQTSFENTEGHDRVAEAVGHLHRHPVSGTETQIFFEVTGETVRVLVDLLERQPTVHAVRHDLNERLALGVDLCSFTDQSG